MHQPCFAWSGKKMELPIPLLACLRTLPFFPSELKWLQGDFANCLCFCSYFGNLSVHEKSTQLHRKKNMLFSKFYFWKLIINL